MGALAILLRALGSPLDALGPLLEPLGASWDPSWSLLGPLVASWGHPGSIRDPSGIHLGGSWGQVGDQNFMGTLKMQKSKKHLWFFIGF